LMLLRAISTLGSRSIIFCLQPNNLLRWPNSSLRTLSWLCMRNDLHHLCAVTVGMICRSVL
jgi:hypothetical protein